MAVKKFFITLILCLLLDQLLKNLIIFNLDYGESITIINNFLSLTLIENTGAAFSILSNSTTFLIVLTIVILILMYFIVIKNQNLSDYEFIVYGILVGGILGNFADRMINGYVIDYIHFYFLESSFPIFNFADICIVIAVILLVVRTFRRKNGI